MGLVASAQVDFSRGAFPLHDSVPDGGVLDLKNALLREDGAIERRGGAAAKSALTAEAIEHLWDGFLSPGERTIMQGSGATIYRLSPTDDTAVATIAAVPAGFTYSKFTGRARALAGMWMRAVAVEASGTPGSMIALYGGASAQAYAGRTGTITLTQGSKTVAGTGTTFTSLLEAGRLLVPGTTLAPTVAVASVTSNTSLELVEPWPYATAAGVTWSSGAVVFTTVQAANGLRGDAFLAVAGGRVFLCKGNKVRMSNFEVDANGTSRGAPTRFVTDEYHQLPDGATVLGAESINDAVAVFTTAGVWVITNPTLDLTDAAGNAQQALVQVNRDMILWGDQGVATWQNTLLVPAADDLYLFTTSANMPQNEVRPITGGARDLYRSYLRSGLRLGQAAVHQGHYVLPVLEPDGTPVDTMVWRVDQAGKGGAPFVGSWSGGRLALSRAFVSRSASVLLASSGFSVVDASPVFTPGTVQDTDDEFDLEVTFRPFTASPTQVHTVRRARVRYELVPQVSITVIGSAGGTFDLTAGGVTATFAWDASTSSVAAWLESVLGLDVVVVGTSYRFPAAAETPAISGDGTALEPPGIPDNAVLVVETARLTLAAARGSGGFVAVGAVALGGPVARAWSVNRTAQQVRLRLTVQDADSVIVRALEVAAEPGRR